MPLRERGALGFEPMAVVTIPCKVSVRIPYDNSEVSEAIKKVRGGEEKAVM